MPSDPSRTEPLTAEQVSQLRFKSSRVDGLRHFDVLDLCDSHEALRAELTRFQGAHRAQEERIKGLRAWAVNERAEAQKAHDAIPQVKPLDFEIRRAYFARVQSFSEVVAWIDRPQPISNAVVDRLKPIAALPAAGAAAASPKETR